jgi:hypothetical protein
MSAFTALMVIVLICIVFVGVFFHETFLDVDFEVDEDLGIHLLVDLTLQSLAIWPF